MTGPDDRRATVDVRWSSIARARDGDGWVQFRGKGVGFDSFCHAVNEADEATSAGSQKDHAVYAVYAVYAAWPAETPTGYVVRLDADDDEQDQWLTHLAERLANRGATGAIAAARTAKIPKWAENTRRRSPTAFVSWSFDLDAAIADPDGARRWYVPADATARIANMADRWARLPDSQLILSQGAFNIALDVEDASGPLAQTPNQAGSGTIEFFRESDHAVTHVSLQPTQQATFQSFCVDAPDWRTQIQRQRDAFTRLPADIDHGYIRYAPAMTLSTQQLQASYDLPGISTSRVWRNPHLHDRYLPDAHGIQIVRTAHLENAHNLSNWNITDLGSGRHLVEAIDLEPWYKTEIPEPDVLAKARADFAGALLTPQVIKTNRSPWY